MVNITQNPMSCSKITQTYENCISVCTKINSGKLQWYGGRSTLPRHCVYFQGISFQMLPDTFFNTVLSTKGFWTVVK